MSVYNYKLLYLFVTMIVDKLIYCNGNCSNTSEVAGGPWELLFSPRQPSFKIYFY